MSATDQKKSVDSLTAENEFLKSEIAMLKGRLNSCEQSLTGRDLGKALCVESGCASPGGANSEGDPEADLSGHLTIVVLGASGDLAVKKTYPALFSLLRHGLLPKVYTVVGYARSEMKIDEFRKKISAKFGAVPPELKEQFLQNCYYVRGQYDSADDFKRMHEQLIEYEDKALAKVEKSSSAASSSSSSSSEKPRGKGPANRIFYFAIPPTAFIPAARSIKASAMSTRGYNRLVVEKPFGRDSASSAELGAKLGALFTEEQIFRIDHYLGKEMVQNLMVLRFANKVFEPLWNRDHVQAVIFSFKEDFGTQGRGGYFDNFGIIRDVMQNHLMQMLSIVAMDAPISLSAEDVRDEKVRLLRAILPITPADTVIGQYTAEHGEPGYLDDADVPKDSVTPTFATCVLHIQNSRWMGVPFIMKSGKALDTKKAEIRIQFKHPVNKLFSDVSPNELVLRVGPDEAVYLKMTTKQPGLDGGNRHTELDLTYKKRFAAETKQIPDAYVRLLYDVIRGDHNLFVRADELAAAWKIFTPLLHAIERDRALTPIPYAFGSRGPPESDELIQRMGYVRTLKYSWEPEDEEEECGGCKQQAADEKEKKTQQQQKLQQQLQQPPEGKSKL